MFCACLYCGFYNAPKYDVNIASSRSTERHQHGGMVCDIRVAHRHTILWCKMTNKAQVGTSVDFCALDLANK